MKWCNSCKVKVDSSVTMCPLCFSALSKLDDVPEHSAYPATLTCAHRWGFRRRLLFVIAFAISVICLTINALTYDGGLWWALIVIGNIVYMWFAVHTMARKHKRIGYNLMLQTISLAVLVVGVGFISGYQVLALDYLLPLLFIVAMISITVVSVAKRQEARQFVFYFFLIAMLGLIPIILYALRLSHVLYPALASAIYSGLSLVSLFVFAHRSTPQELTKRFHL